MRPQPNWNESTPEGSWRSLAYDDLIKRDNVNFDVFWHKDNGLEDSDDHSAPDILAHDSKLPSNNSKTSPRY